VQPEELSRYYSGKKVLITGGLGFIGSNLAHRLVGLQADVTLLDCLYPDQGGNRYNIRGIEDRVTVSTSDVRDAESTYDLVKGKDCVFHLAGQVFHVDSMRDPMEDLDLNCRGHLVLLEACRKSNPEAKVVFAGTRQVYGRPDYLPLDEDHPVRPVDINGIHKAAAEHYQRLYHEVYGLRATSLRLTNTYGPRQLMRHSRAGFTGWLVHQAIDGEEITIFGDGSQLRDFTFVEDAVEGFLLCGASDETDGKVYNLGGEKPYSLAEFADMLVALCGSGSYRLVPFPEERRRIDVGSTYCAYDRIARDVGWSPRVNLESGLRLTIDYFRQNRRHYW